jgi:hypothetical protein
MAAATTTGKNTTKNALNTGSLLPAQLTYKDETNGDTAMTFEWSSNSCTFKSDDSVLTFEYNEETRSLKFSSVISGDSKSYGNILRFDEQGRVTSVGYDADGESTVIMGFGYENDTVSITSCIDCALELPFVITPNLEDRTVMSPPFDDPSVLLYFTPYGDMTGTSESQLYTYGYDDYGNIEAVYYADTIHELSYTDMTMTDAWQRYAVKFVISYVLGASFPFFAVDVLCSAMVK